MSFSTWSREFREHERSSRRVLLLVAGVILAPLLWLASLQAGFDLTYPACWWGWRSLLVMAVLAPVPIIIAIAWLIRRREPPRASAGPEEAWPQWLASLGLLSCALFLLVSVAMLAPIIGLDPCR